MRLFHCLVCIFISTSTLAEVIDGPANLRESPKGEVAVSLNNGVSVSVVERSGSWYKVKLLAFVSMEDYFGQGNLNANIALKDMHGLEIGHSISSFSNFESFKMGNMYGLVIMLYTYKSNIVAESILEERVVSLINVDSLDENTLQRLKYFEMQRWSNVDGYDTGIVFEPVTEPMGQAIRIILFFENGKVVAFAGNPKFEYYDFDCIGKSKVSNRNLTIHYLTQNAYLKKTRVEETFGKAFRKMD